MQTVKAALRLFHGQAGERGERLDVWRVAPFDCVPGEQVMELGTEVQRVSHDNYYFRRYRMAWNGFAILVRDDFDFMSGSNTIHKRTPFYRAALIALLLLGFVGLQTASVVHPHDDGGLHTHCCPVCHAGHLPLLHAISTIPIAAPVLGEWRTSPQDTLCFGENPTVFNSSRAPPA